MDPKRIKLKNGIKNNPRRYALLLGAGVSVSARVPLAVEDVEGIPSIVSHIKFDTYCECNPGKPVSQKNIEEWLRDKGLLQRQESLYPDAVDLRGFGPAAHRSYLERFF